MVPFVVCAYECQKCVVFTTLGDLKGDSYQSRVHYSKWMPLCFGTAAAFRAFLSPLMLAIFCGFVRQFSPSYRHYSRAL